MNVHACTSNRKYIIKITTIFLTFGLFLFVPAGTLNWPEAWLLFIIYLIWMILQMKYMKERDPELFAARMDSSKKASIPWDIKIMRGITIVFFLIIILAGLDAGRYHWSYVPVNVKIIAFACLIPTLAWHLWIMRENTFLSTRVEIQRDRGHKVVTTGPYKYVRHPMYAANMIMYLCMPLALGSFYALCPAVLMMLIFIIRTRLEDRTLMEELGGYKEYAEIVQYKLFPHIW